MMKFVSAILPTLMLGLGCHKLTTVDSKYDDVPSAQRVQAFAKGRLPQWLPRNSRSILERTNLDSSEVWIRFDLPETDCHDLRVSTEPVKGNAVFGAHERPQWWPDSLVGQVRIGATTIGELDVRVVRQGNDLVALNCNSGRVFVYRNLRILPVREASR